MMLTKLVWKQCLRHVPVRWLQTQLWLPFGVSVFDLQMESVPFFSAAHVRKKRFLGCHVSVKQ